MVTPEGSQNQHSTEAPNHTNDPSVPNGATRIGWNLAVAAPDGGRNGSHYWELEPTEQGDTWRGPKPIPPVAGRFERGDGIVYLIPTETGSLYAAPATEVHRGDAWYKTGYKQPKGDALTAWLWVAHTHPLAPLSPKITQGLPPLAPALAPLTEDADRARRGWGWMADRLAPAGRLAVGMGLFSPWMQQHGVPRVVLSLHGKAGHGKSVLGALIAALFGDPGEDSGLFTSMNAAAQGLSSWAQELAYYPMVLDEAQTATGDISVTLTQLVMGANRKRAGRSGVSQKNSAKWHSLCVVTSNDPLPLTHEMFDRRLVAINAPDLWQPRDETLTSTQHWGQVWDALPVIAGWPWVALTEAYPPGPGAARLVEQVRRVAEPPSVHGDSSRLMQLGIAGCMWLADWTGNEAWTAGVRNAATVILAERAEDATDPARDAARAIVESIATTPDAWARGAHGPTVGWPSAHRGACAVAHPEDSDCAWWDVARLTDLVDADPQRLAGTAFRAACFTTEAKGLSRKVRVDGSRVRVVTVCSPALSALAYPEGTTPAAPAPEVEARVRFDAPPTVTQTVPVVVDSTDERDDPGAALDGAAARGVTDLVAPAQWRGHLARDKALGAWDVGGWQGLGTGAGRVSRDGREVRVWLDSDPDRMALALDQWVGAGNDLPAPSIPVTGQQLIIAKAEAARERNGSKMPRWQLPKHLAEIWTPAEVAHPAGWGAPAGTAGLTQWDRNRSHLGAITQANVAPLWVGEDYEHYDGETGPAPSSSIAGMWRIVIPEWHNGLPPVHGTEPTGAEKWVSGELLRLYHELDVHPTVIESWSAPVHKVPGLVGATEQIKEWLAEFDGEPAAVIPKRMYQSMAGNLRAEHNRGRAKRIYRPDWSVAIADNSWCNVLRRVYKIAAADGTWVPARVNVDAIYYDRPGVPPGLPVGDGLGEYKEEVA